MSRQYGAGLCRRHLRTSQRLMVVGTIADIIEEQFRRHFAQLGITEVDFFPAARADDLPAVGPGTRIFLRSLTCE